MAINKKGVFLSLTSILMIGALFLVFSADVSRTDQQAITQRVQDFAQDKQLLEQQVIPPLIRSYVRQSLNELALQGGASSLEGLELQLANCLGANKDHKETETSFQTSCGSTTIDNSFLQAEAQIQQLYRERMRYHVEMTIHNISLQQVGTWSIIADVNLSLVMNETSGITRYQNPIVVSTLIPIEGLIDPFSSEIRGSSHRIERYARSEINVNWSEDNLRDHAIRGTYVSDRNATSYLARMTGSSASSNFGMHSLIVDGNNTAHSPDFDTQSYPEVCLIRVPIGEDDLYLTGPYADKYRQFSVLQDTEGNQQYNELACKNS